MKKSRRDFVEIFRQVRKPMPPSEKVIPNEKDLRKNERFDWRRELELDELDKLYEQEKIDKQNKEGDKE